MSALSIVPLSLFQTLADQSGSTVHGCPVAIKKSDLEARASENDGPSAAHKADAHYCDFSRHVLSIFFFMSVERADFEIAPDLRKGLNET